MGVLWRLQVLLREGGRLTCVYPQVDLQVVGGAEGLATVGAVLGGRAQRALSNLCRGGRDAPGRLRRVLPSV